MDDTLKISQRILPHWRLQGSAYLVTWCLAEDQKPLTPSERTTIVENLKRFHNERYHLLAYVVMDDHVHTVTYPFPDRQLSEIIHGWKSYTANRLQRLHGRKGHIWLQESHDRIIRSESDLNEKLEYVLTNPVRRWPGSHDYEWVGWMGK